jgi:murein DD-endopeptidase MepM/ murein hydrolase activator NlpD
MESRTALGRQALEARLSGEAAQVRGRLADLAGRLGGLQGRMLAMEALRARVAEASGLGYVAPELAADTGRDGDLDDELTPVASGFAERLGRRIDALARRLDGQEDAYALMDAALSRQAGRRASLPTASPVDFPYLSSSFGWRRNPVSGRPAMHQGLDFAAPRGTPVHAASGGVVVRAGRAGGYGRMVEIDHGNGLRSRYAHAASLLVGPGDVVRRGDLIARVGSSGRSTGAHLHFEIRIADHPLDPEPFIRQDARVRLAGRAGDASGGSDAGG